MKLYKNSNGVWAGTQADARKMCGKGYQTVDVPTDKPSLLRFLNANKVGSGKDMDKYLGFLEKNSEYVVPDDERPDQDLNKKALSYFEWGYDTLCRGDFTGGTEYIRKALLYQKTHNIHEEAS